MSASCITMAGPRYRVFFLGLRRAPWMSNMGRHHGSSPGSIVLSSRISNQGHRHHTMDHRHGTVIIIVIFIGQSRPLSWAIITLTTHVVILGPRLNQILSIGHPLFPPDARCSMSCRAAASALSAGARPLQPREESVVFANGFRPFPAPASAPHARSTRPALRPTLRPPRSGARQPRAERLYG